MPAEINVPIASTTAATLSLVRNMALTTPSVRAATLAETTPAAACPAATCVAALIVDAIRVLANCARVRSGDVAVLLLLVRASRVSCIRGKRMRRSRSPQGRLRPLPISCSPSPLRGGGWGEGSGVAASNPSPPAPLPAAGRGEKILASREDFNQISMKRSEAAIASIVRPRGGPRCASGSAASGSPNKPTIRGLPTTPETPSSRLARTGVGASMKFMGCCRFPSRS